VSTNVPGKGSTSLTIKGTIWQPVQVTPKSVAFGRITADKAGAGLVKKMTIVNNVDGVMTLTDVASTNPIFKPEIRPIEAGKKYELIVTLQPPLKSGNNTGKITMKTGLAETASLEIPAYAYVSLPVDVTPAQLTLPSGRTANLQRQFYVRSNTNKPVVLSDLKASNPELKLVLADIRKQLTYRLTVDIPASYKPSAGGDTISFKTDDPAVPSIVIPITEQTARQRVPRPHDLTAKRRGTESVVPANTAPPAKDASAIGATKAKEAGKASTATKLKTRAVAPKAGPQTRRPTGAQITAKKVTNEDTNTKKSKDGAVSATKTKLGKDAVANTDRVKKPNAPESDAERLLARLCVPKHLRGRRFHEDRRPRSYSRMAASRAVLGPGLSPRYEC
jgi:hypothetical protein